MVNSIHKGVVGAVTRDEANILEFASWLYTQGCPAALGDETYSVLLLCKGG